MLGEGIIIWFKDCETEYIVIIILILITLIDNQNTGDYAFMPRNQGYK